MYAFCPKCETELDQNTGICPACRWDPLTTKAQQPVGASTSELSLTERYRGTQFDVVSSAVAGPGRSSTVSRGRTLVIIGLVAALGLYGLVIGTTGLL